MIENNITETSLHKTVYGSQLEMYYINQLSKSLLSVESQAIALDHLSEDKQIDVSTRDLIDKVLLNNGARITSSKQRFWQRRKQKKEFFAVDIFSPEREFFSGSEVNILAAQLWRASLGYGVIPAFRQALTNSLNN